MLPLATGTGTVAPEPRGERIGHALHLEEWVEAGRTLDVMPDRLVVPHDIEPEDDLILQADRDGRIELSHPSITGFVYDWESRF